MILHLLSESKFDSLIMNQIEECCPGENLFLLLSSDKGKDIKKSSSNHNIIFKRDFPTIDFNRIEGVIIHYLSIKKARLVKTIPGNIPLAWSIWGADFYNFLPEFRNNLYGELTNEYLNHTLEWHRLYRLFRDRFFFFNSHDYKLWQNAVQRTKVFSTVIPYERKQVEKYFNSEAKYCPLPTYSIEKVINTYDYEKTICTKEYFVKNILIGNSGHLSNNHLEILHFFKKYKNEDISVHAPLTYGEDKYIKYICKTGNSLLGKKFLPHLEHLNNFDYLNFLNRLNIFVFNSYRQQGIGTITMALWSGGKVFLSNKNVTSSFYRDSGLKIYSIEDDLLVADSHEFFKPLTREDILINRRGLLNLYSDKIVNNSLKYFFRKLKE